MEIYWLNAALSISPNSRREEKLLTKLCDTFIELLSNVELGDGFDSVDDSVEEGCDEFRWTPRNMKCESVKGHRLPDVNGRDDETGLWDEPPGTWRWRLGGPRGERVMQAVLPSRYPDGPGIVHPYQTCDCRVVEGPIPAPGKKICWGWDGNVDAPTLSGSISVDTTWGEHRERVFWHGYMEAGNFRACE